MRRKRHYVGALPFLAMALTVAICISLKTEANSVTSNDQLTAIRNNTNIRNLSNAQHTTRIQASSSANLHSRRNRRPKQQHQSQNQRNNPIKSASSSLTSNVSRSSSHSQSQSQLVMPRDPVQLAQKVQLAQMFGHGNTPPTFITNTRDLFVDVSRFTPATKISTIKSLDVDGDILEYSIQPASFQDASAYFAINSTSGELSLSNKPLRYYPPLSSNKQDTAINQYSDSSTATEVNEEQDDNSDEQVDDASNSPVANNTKSFDQANGDGKELINKNLYWLVVSVNDGIYNSTIEFQIHVINSSALADFASGLVQLPHDGGRMSSELYDSFFRKKKDEYYSQQMNMNEQTSESSFKVVYPDYVNPGITRPGISDSEPIQQQKLDSTQIITPNFQSTFASETQEHEQSSYTSTSLPIISSQSGKHFSSALFSTITPPSRDLNISTMAASDRTSPLTPVGLSQLQLVAFSIFCSCLMIILLVVIFVPSVKQLKQRLKHVEMQHHLSIQQQQVSSLSSNCGSSSIVCSLASSAMNTMHNRSHCHGHIGSDGSATSFGSGTNNYHDQTSVFCHQSDSQLQMERMGYNNGNINSILGLNGNTSVAENPVYLRGQHPAVNMMSQQQQQLNSRMTTLHSIEGLSPLNLQNNQLNAAQHNFIKCYQDDHNDSQPHGLISYISNNTNSNGIQQRGMRQQRPTGARPQPILFDDNFKSTSGDNIYYPIEDESYTTINNDTSSTFNVSKYNVESAIDTDVLHDPVRQTDSPDSGSSVRSLVRFLSLPNRHQNNSNQGTNSNETETQFSDIINDQVNHDSSDEHRHIHHNGTNTIARGSNVQRESRDSTNSWELDRGRLTMLKMIDEGQFGFVWRCQLKPAIGDGKRAQAKTVAVKMLKSSASKVDLTREELLTEIDIMKKVCDHPNVVKILYCCTKQTKNSLGSSVEPIMLVMEYLELGNLQTFLRLSRKNILPTASASKQIQPQQQFDSDDLDFYIEGSDRSHLTIEDDYNTSFDPSTAYQVTSRELIKYIYHVAQGMEYISSKGIVHRDLASRNILISADRVCKIGDFGMARSINYLKNNTDTNFGIRNDYDKYQSFYERRSKNTKIPVRWMAPEVMLQNRFTIKSDVFSMGILMWEIVTLGETPYKHLKTDQVMRAVANGRQRPEKPDYCHGELYGIMSSCWTEHCHERPTFRNLVKDLEKLLKSSNNYIELDLYPDHNYLNINNQDQ